MSKFIPNALLRKAIVLLLAFLLCGGVLLAQTSSVSGVVTDAQGGVIPGVEVTLINPATGNQRTTLSDDTGRYQFAQVNPGIHEIHAALAGFKTAVIGDVVLKVDVPTRQDIRLEVGEVSEVITVTSESMAALNTLDATLGNAFNEQQLEALPLNSRNVVNLLTLQPGVTAEGEVSGARRDQSNMTLDGIDVNDNQSAGSQPGLDASQPGYPAELSPVLRITPDSVQEFRVTVANPSASQGRSSGGQVSLITKSGSNEWHGSAYYFHRNTATTANEFFNNRVEPDPIPRPDLKRHLFGGSIGGPILEDKAFFFFNYEGREDKSATSVLRTVPLPHLGQGNVRYESSVTGLPVELTPDDILQVYGPGVGGINPVTVGILRDAASRYPANDHGAGDQINTDGFRFNAPTPLKQNTYIARVDVNLADNMNLYVRGNYQWDTQSTAPQFPDTPAPTIWSHPVGMAVGHTWNIQPTFINTFRYGLTRQAYSRQGDQDSNFMTFRAVYQPILGQSTLSRVTPTHNIVNDTSWIKGSHTIAFGTNIRLIDNSRDSTGNAWDNATSNAFFYQPGSLTDPVGDVSGGTDTPFRHAMAAVLGRLPQYGAAFTFSGDGDLLPVGTASARSFATYEFDLYVEDNWQIASDLTLNFGLRWGYSDPAHETTGFQVQPTFGLGQFLKDRIAGAKRGQSLNTEILVDQSGPYYDRPGYYPPDKNNFMPRVSAAWTPNFDNGILRTIFGGNGESVFRGGFAMMYDRVGSQLAVTFDNANTLGFNSSTTISANTYDLSTNIAPLFTGFDQDFRTLPGITIPDGLEFPVSKPMDNARRIEGALNSDLTTPVNYAWNFSIGRELAGGFFLEGSYVGRSARNLYARQDAVHPNDFVDPASGQSWYQAAAILQEHRWAGTALEDVAPIPFFENVFPNVASNADYRWWIWGMQDWFGIDPNSLTPSQLAYAFISPDYMDALDWTYLQDQWDLHGLDPGQDNVFYHPQYGAFIAFDSVAKSTYHAFTLTARERFSDDLTVDFNYTWGKSFDNASGLQSAGITGGTGLIKNPIEPEQEHSVSDFDTNHIINANWLYHLPIGLGRKWGGNMHPALDAVIGGWSLNGIFRWNSGRPWGSPFESGRWGTNWQISSNTVRIRDPRADPHKGGDEPNFWNDEQYAYNSFRDAKAGEVGDRNTFRLPSYVVFDFGLHKSFSMPYNENHKLTFRWEVFNATNTQKLEGPSTTGMGTSPEISEMRPNFGIITGTQGLPRIMQFGLRFEF